jgi:hypothetical protein
VKRILSKLNDTNVPLLASPLAKRVNYPYSKGLYFIIRKA